jgi:hypothetical protein
MSGLIGLHQADIGVVAQAGDIDSGTASMKSLRRFPAKPGVWRLLDKLERNLLQIGGPVRPKISSEPQL